MKKTARVISVNFKEIIVLAACAVFIIGIFFYANPRAPIASSETRFVERSSGGLQIVPASCPSSPSNPDYPHNTCGGGGSPVACVLSADPQNVTNSGDLSRLSLRVPTGFPNNSRAAFYELVGGNWVSIGYGNGRQTSSATTEVNKRVNPTRNTTYRAGVYTAAGANLLAGYCNTVVTLGASCSPPRSLVSGQCRCPLPNSVYNAGSNTCRCPIPDQIVSGGSCVCPSGTILDGNSCVPPPPSGSCTLRVNPTGMNSGNSTNLRWTYPSSANRIVINQGVGTQSTSPDSRAVSPTVTRTYTGQAYLNTATVGNSCTATVTVCNASHEWNGVRCVPRQCSGTAQWRCVDNDSREFVNAQCQVTQNQDCNPGYHCDFPTATCRANPAEIDIGVEPRLVRSGNTTRLTWTSIRAASCTVRGTNGDAWDTRSGTNIVSSAITERTVYTLTCVGLDGETETDQAIVNIIPVFCELGAPNCSN